MKKNKLKKIAAMVLGLCIGFSPCTAFAQPGTNPDYSTLSKWAERDVYECWENNILQPYMARDFKNSITRGEFCDLCVIVLSKWYDCDFIETENVPRLKEIADKSSFEGFSDTGSWYAEFCAKLGIISGMGDGTFRPDDPITREQAAKMLYNTLDIATPYLSDLRAANENGINSVFIPHVFADGADIQNWARLEIYTMYNLGVMMGDTNNCFNPQESYTREQSFCTFLRLYKLIVAPDEVNAPEKAVFPPAGNSYIQRDSRYYLDAAYSWDGSFEPVYYDGDGKEYSAKEKDYVYPVDEKYMEVLTSVGVGAGSCVIIDKNKSEVTVPLYKVEAIDGDIAVYMEKDNFSGESLIRNLATGEDIRLHITGKGGCGFLQFCDDEGNIGYCDINGNTVISALYKNTHASHTFINDLCVLQKQNGSFAIINTKGEELKTFSLDLEKYYIAEVMGTNILLQENGDNGGEVVYRAYSGKTVNGYGRYDFSSKGNIIAYKDYKPYLLDSSGNLLCDLSAQGYDNIEEVDGLYFRVCKIDKTNYSKIMPCDIMDFNGKIIRKGVTADYLVSADGLTAYKSSDNEITVFDVRGEDIGVIKTPQNINTFKFINGLLDINYGETGADIWAYYTPSGKEAVKAAWSNMLASAENKSDVTEAEIDYGKSELYSQEDMDKAIKLIKEEFSGWEGCGLHNIKYTTDACNSQENLLWMNDLAKGQNLGIVFTQCIGFESDFHSPVNPKNPGAWNIDYEYTDWQWWLARADGGDWRLMTWGY